MIRKPKSLMFQILLLDNGESEDVEVYESEGLNFCQVKEHLKNGGSVFITNRADQKIEYPRNRSHQNYSRSRRTSGFLFRQRLRN